MTCPIHPVPLLEAAPRSDATSVAAVAWWPYGEFKDAQKKYWSGKMAAERYVETLLETLTAISNANGGDEIGFHQWAAPQDDAPCRDQWMGIGDAGFMGLT